MFSSNTSQVSGDTKYIEDYFSTFLYSGTGAAQTITNNIDLSTKGGLVWLKARNDTRNNWLYDTVRGKEYGLRSDLNFAENYSTNSITAFNNNGFSIGDSGNINTSGNNLVSWSWAKAPKFFDVVTYTGNGTARTISHSLGSVPACIIVKQTSAAGEDWAVYHRGLPLVAGSLNDNFLTLNTTSAYSTSTDIWNRTVPTSTVFSVGNHPSTNSNGASYVAYLFAHDAGGFGLTGTDNVISCGSFTDTTTVNLGYEPQWVLFKKSSSSSIGDWFIADNMRGFSETSINTLSANTSSAEVSYSNTGCVLTSTGFTYNTGLAGSGTFIYIAIRRGPMKVPTSGTSVFSPNAQAGNGGNDTVTTGFTTDLVIGGSRTANPIQGAVDRLRGRVALLTANTAAEDPCPSGRDLTSFASNTGFTLGYPPFATSFNYTGNNIYWNFRRAPSFFDEVCYTGNGGSKTLTHNLGVAPELIIFKSRSAAENWVVFADFGPVYFRRAYLDLTNSAPQFGYGGSLLDSAPTATTISLLSGTGTNSNAATYVAYLFATCAGVSKVGSYTGTGTTKQIDCGFTGGARFVLIKRTDSTGDWYVWDTARGIVSGNDPYLLLNSTSAEVTSTDYIDTYSAGFEISSTAPAAINASGGTFIFLAIA